MVMIHNDRMIYFWLYYYLFYVTSTCSALYWWRLFYSSCAFVCDFGKIGA